MKRMFVLLNRPEDIEGYLTELKNIAITHGVMKIYLARLPRDFNPRARSIMAPQKLDMAARMGDAAASKYLREIANTLCGEGIDCESISSDLPATEIAGLIKERDADVIVGVGTHSGLPDLLGKWTRGRLAQFPLLQGDKETAYLLLNNAVYRGET